MAMVLLVYVSGLTWESPDNTPLPLPPPLAIIEILCALNMEVDIISLAAQEIGYIRVTLEQQLVVESFIRRHLTGSAKSMCYWIFPPIFNSQRRKKWIRL